MPTRTTYVYMHLTEGAVPAGRLDMTEDGRNSYATFQYGNRYLRRSNRVAVDPATLPLPDANASPQTFRTADGFELFNGIRDAAPDGWGRYLMHKAAGSENLTDFDYLVASGEQRVGALAFGPDPIGGPKRIALWGETEAAGERFDLANLPRRPNASNQSINWNPISGLYSKLGRPLAALAPRRLRFIVAYRGSQNSRRRAIRTGSVEPNLPSCSLPENAN